VRDRYAYVNSSDRMPCGDLKERAVATRVLRSCDLRIRVSLLEVYALKIERRDSRVDNAGAVRRERRIITIMLVLQSCHWETSWVPETITT
jgi:hypothetical protein